MARDKCIGFRTYDPTIENVDLNATRNATSLPEISPPCSDDRNWFFTIKNVLKQCKLLYSFPLAGLFLFLHAFPFDQRPSVVTAPYVRPCFFNIGLWLSEILIDTELTFEYFTVDIFEVITGQSKK